MMNKAPAAGIVTPVVTAPSTHHTTTLESIAAPPICLTATPHSTTATPRSVRFFNLHRRIARGTEFHVGCCTCSLDSLGIQQTNYNYWDGCLSWLSRQSDIPSIVAVI